MKNLILAALCLISIGLQAHSEYLRPCEKNPIHEQLMEAVKDNDVIRAESLLIRGAKPNDAIARERNSFSVESERRNAFSGTVYKAPCLFIALFKGNIEMVELLISYKAELDTLVTFVGKREPNYIKYDTPVALQYKYIMPVRRLVLRLITLLELSPKKEIVDLLNKPDEYFQEKSMWGQMEASL